MAERSRDDSREKWSPWMYLPTKLGGKECIGIKRILEDAGRKGIGRESLR